MKLLIDENLPKRLKLDFTEYEIFTVFDKGCRGSKNGESLKLMLNKNFKVLLTFNKNLQFQQNFNKYPITVLVLNTKDNSYPSVSPLISQIKKTLTFPLAPGLIEIKVQ